MWVDTVISLRPVCRVTGESLRPCEPRMKTLWSGPPWPVTAPPGLAPSVREAVAHPSLAFSRRRGERCESIRVMPCSHAGTFGLRRRGEAAARPNLAFSRRLGEQYGSIHVVMPRPGLKPKATTMSRIRPMTLGYLPTATIASGLTPMTLGIVLLCPIFLGQCAVWKMP